MKASSFWKANLSAFILLILFQRESARVPDSSPEPPVSLGHLHKERRPVNVLPTEVTTCGGVSRRRTGLLQTPAFPSPFPVPFRCNWIIDASAFPGSSIVVYLTQVFVTKGLRFESFAFLDIKGALSIGNDSKDPESSFSSFDRRLVFDSDSRSLKEVSWIRFNSPYLLATLALDRLEGSHIRDFGQLLRVYGLNMTYEVISKSQSVRKRRCSLLECSMAGHCFAKKDFRSFYCSCFEGYFGSHCQYSRFCDPSKNMTLCLNGGTCRHMGSTAFHCLCKEGFSGALCQYKDVTGTNNLSKVSKCKRNDCTRVCPFDGESACNCSLKSNETTKSRYAVAIKWTNISLLQNKSISLLKAIFREQLQVFIKHQNTLEVKEIKINSISENGDVSFEFIANEKKIEEFKDAFSNSNSSLGNLTFLSEHPAYQFENQLLLKDVVVNEKEVPLEGEFTASCIAQGSPSMEFTWFKNGVQVDHTLAVRHMWQRLLDMDSKGSYTALLRITAVAAEDDGDLWCHVKDAGIHQWKATRVKVVKPNPVIVRPRMVSLLKGENGSIACISSNEQGLNPDTLEFFWIKNDTHLVRHDNHEIVENLYPSGSILHIYNASTSATYTCHVIKKIGSSVSHQHSFAVNVNVAEPVSPLCPPTYAWGVNWPRIASSQQAITECPYLHQRKIPHLHSVFSALNSQFNSSKLRGPFGENIQWKGWDAFEEEAKRSCVEEDGKAKWEEEPDFSKCQWDPLMTIQNKFRKLTLGYKTTTILESLRQLSDLLTSSVPYSGDNMQIHDSFNQKPPSLYPGQGESVVSFLSDVQEYLQLKAKVKRHASEWRSITINMFEIVSKLLRREYTIKNVQRILQVMSLIVKQILLWNDKLSDHYIASFHYPEIESSHEREMLDTKNNESDENLIHRNKCLQDYASIAVLSEPTSWDHENITNLVSNLHYPRDEKSRPKWLSDKVRCQVSLTTKKKLEKFNKDIQKLNQSDSYEVYGETLKHDEQNIGSNGSLSALQLFDTYASSAWTLIAFQNHGSILSLNYTANTRYGYELEHHLSSNIILVDITKREILDKSQIPIPARGNILHQSINSSFDLTIEFFLKFHSLPDLKSSKEKPRVIWNVTCAQILFSDNSVNFTSATGGNHWKLDSCNTIPSSAMKNWILGKSIIRENNMSQEVKDSYSVMCQCKQPGAYAVLVLLKKMKVPDSSHGDTPIDGKGKWILIHDYVGMLLGTCWMTSFGCGFCFLLTFASLIFLLYQFSSLLCIAKVKKKHQVYNSSCSKHLNYQQNTRKHFLCNPMFWIHLFKIQFCIAVMLVMALIIFAFQSSPDKLSHPCIKISLVVLLLVAMSSQLGKVLITYAEVMTASCIISLTSVAGGVNFAANETTEMNGTNGRKNAIDIQRLKSKANSFLQRLNPSIWGAVTGMPILVALLANLSHETTTLESWWLISGSLLFKAFITSSAVISFAFASLLTCLLRNLSTLHSFTATVPSVEDGIFVISDPIQQQLPQCGFPLIQERITLLKISASIFASLMSMILWSIVSINTTDVRFTWYIFSSSCLLLGLAIFFCYVIKSDVSPCICRILKLMKGNFCSENVEIETRCKHKDKERGDSLNLFITLLIEVQLNSRSKEKRNSKQELRERSKRNKIRDHINIFCTTCETIRKQFTIWFRNKGEVNQGSEERSGTSMSEAAMS